MPSRISPPINVVRLTALNFGIQFVWGAILAVSLQARALELTHDGVRTYAALASSGAGLGALTQIVVGRWADARYAAVGHRREFYGVGVGLAIPALVWFFLASSPEQLAMAFFAVQIGINTVMGPYQAAIPDHVPRERAGAASSWMSAYQSLGNAAGLLVAGFVRSYAVVALVLCGGLALSFALTFAHTRRLARAAGTAERLRIGGPLLTLLLSRGSINVGFYTLLGFLLFFVRDSLGIRDPATLRMQTALLFLSFTLAAIVGAIIAARPSDRYDKRLIVNIAVGVIVVALALLAAAPTLAFAYPSAAFAGIAWGAFVTSDWALACAVLPTGAMASAMGLWNVATAVPQVLAPLLAAPLVVRFNAITPGLGPRAAIGLSIVAFAVGAASIWRLPAGLVNSRAYSRA